MTCALPAVTNWSRQLYPMLPAGRGFTYSGFSALGGLLTHAVPVHEALLQLEGRLVGDWHVRGTLPVKAMLEDGLFLIASDDVLAYGSGDTLSDAISDYRQRLVDHYLLTEDAVRKSGLPGDVAELHHLQRYVEHRSC